MGRLAVATVSVAASFFCFFSDAHSASRLECFRSELRFLKENYLEEVATGKIRLPTLVFETRSLHEIVKDLITPHTVIVTAEANVPELKGLGVPLIVAKEILLEQAAEIRDQYHPEHVIALGGSTALDLARAVAIGKRLDSIPTVLSTACISVNKTIARDGATAEAVITQTPNQTIIPLKTLNSMPDLTRKLWSQSGFGDVFARVSASIDVAFQDHQLKYEQVLKNTPDKILNGLTWVKENFQSYDDNALRTLASLSHDTSLEIVRAGNSLKSVGGEHQFYYKVMERHTEFYGKVPTHGQIVAVGTLIAAGAMSERTGDARIYLQLLDVFKKLGLPVSYEELNAIHLDRDILVQGLKDLEKPNTLLKDYFKDGNFNLLDRIFGS